MLIALVDKEADCGIRSWTYPRTKSGPY